MQTYYQPDLAYVHDADYSQLAVDAAQCILSLCRNKEPHSLTVVDLGCGSGILAAQLAEQGMAVWGVDISADMLAIAKARSPQSRFMQASLFSVDIPSCTVVCSIGECLCYLFDENSNAKAVEQLFARVYAALLPGGYFVCDFLSPSIVSQRRVIENERWSMFLDVSVDETTHILTRDIILFRKQGETYIRSHEVHRQQLYEPKFMKQLLSNAGFHAQQVDNYAGNTFRQGHFGFIATKPE